MRGAKTAFLVLTVLLAATNVSYAQQFRLPNAGQLNALGTLNLSRLPGRTNHRRAVQQGLGSSRRTGL
jgi:hypothetical protein